MTYQAPPRAPRHGTPDTLDDFFDLNRQAPQRYSGQAATWFQQALLERHASVGPADCEFYHTIELPDGRVHPGDWDLRGHEAEYLGGVDVAGKRVIEFGPASGWMSSYLAARAELTVLDLPFGAAPEFVPHPAVDLDRTRADAAASAERLRNSWWYTRRQLGFRARAVYADIYQLPPDIGRQDVAFFGAILLHLSNPFAALQQAARLTDEAIIVTDVDSSPKLPGYDGLTASTPGVTVFNPTEPPFGMTHWWAVSPGMVAHMLRRLGFTEIEATQHRPPRMGEQARMFTVVGRRPAARRQAAAEALPVPPGKLRFTVSGTEDEDTFLRLGRLGFEAIMSSLAAAGVEPAALGRVLDFGCGVGRVTRYWTSVAGASETAVEVEGTDLAADSIAWARANLGFAGFAVNGLDPVLGFDGGRFGLVYALSVFTHLPKAMQIPWLTELGRVTRPGGLVYLTTHGVRYRGLLTLAEQGEFDRGAVVVTGGEQPGSNHCAAFHPAGWMERAAVQLGWILVEHRPCGALGNPEQDSWLFRTGS